MTEGIYRFYWDCGRNGHLSGIFLATADEVEDLIGREVHFGEVLGKHSDVYGTIEDGEITLVTTDPAAVAVFRKFDLSEGYNPFSYSE